MSQRVRLFYRKDGEARYLSHLDLTAVIEFAVRRARLPVELSEGFNPRPRIALAAALVTGYIGEREIAEISLREVVAPDEVGVRLQAVLPAGLTILSVEALPARERGAASRVRAATYRIELAAPCTALPEHTHALAARASIELVEEREGTPRTRDVRPSILMLEAPDTRTIRMTLALGQTTSMRPDALLGLLPLDLRGARFFRERIDLEPEVDA
jgi:radical SAM-linked protein